MAKSNGFTVYMAMRITMIENVIFKANRKSSRKGGNGIIITTKMPTTPNTMKVSLRFENAYAEFFLFLLETM